MYKTGQPLFRTQTVKCIDDKLISVIERKIRTVLQPGFLPVTTEALSFQLAHQPALNTLWEYHEVWYRCSLGLSNYNKISKIKQVVLFHIQKVKGLRYGYEL